MRNALTRLDQLLDQLMTSLDMYVDRMRAPRRSHMTGRTTRLLSLPERGKRQAIWRAAWPLLAFAAAYVTAWSYLFIAAFLGDQPPPAPLFPPGAVLFAALLLTPPRRWWLFLVAAFVIQVPILAYLHLPLSWNLLGFTPDAVEPIVAASLIRRFTPLPIRFASLREVSIYTACVAAAVFIGATLGAAVNAGIGGQPYWTSWETWFLGDFLSYLVLAPTLLLWIAAGAGGLRAGSRWRYAEAALLYGGLLAMGLSVFDTHLLGPDTAHALIYLPVPLLLWAAVRFGPRGIASALSLIVILAIPAVADALGPFASDSTPASATLGNIFTLQLFLLVIGVPLFFLSVLVQERAQAAEALRTSVARYRTVVRSLPQSAVLLFDENLRHSFADGPGLEVLGLTPGELEGRSVREAFPTDLAAALAPQYEAALSDMTIAVDVEHAQHIYHLQVVPMPASTAATAATATSSSAATPAGMAVLQDVTEQRHARDELERERTLSTLLGALNQQFRTLAEHSPDFIARLDPLGRHVYMNPSGVDLLGLTQEQWAGKTIAELGMRQDVYERWAQALRDVVETHAPRTFEVDVPSPDGQVRSLHVRYIPELADTGRLLSVLAVATDITDLKQAKARLAEQASEFEAIFEAKADGVAVFDLQGHFMRANSALRQLLGFDSEYSSLPLEERAQRLRLFDEQGQPLTPEQWPQWHVLRGEILTGASAMEAGVQTLDGRQIAISITGAPVRAPNGQVTGTVLITRDVTARRALERQVAEQAAKLEAIFEAMADGILVQDLEGNRAYANEAYHRLLRRHLELQGHQVELDALFTAPLSEWERLIAITDERGDPIPPDAWATARALRGEILTGECATDEFTRGTDGSIMQVSVSAAPVRNASGQITGAVAVFRDVTARRALERQVAEQASELEAIFEAMSDGVVVYDSGGHLVRANRAWQNTFRTFSDQGTSSADASIAALPFAAQVERWHQSVRSNHYQFWDAHGHAIPLEQTPSYRALRGDTVTGANAVDERFERADGRVLEVSVSAAPIRDAAGTITGAVAVSREVTAHRQLERQVREQAAQLEAIFEAMTDGVFVLDADGHMTRINAAAQALFHLATGEDRAPEAIDSTAAGRARALDLGDGAGEAIPLAQLPTTRLLNGEVFAGATALALQFGTHTDRMRTISLTGGPLRDATGRIAGAVGVVRDVTELQRVQTALAAQERLFRTLVENTPDIIARFDRDLRYLYINPAITHVAPIPPEYYLGKTNQELGWPESIYAPAHRAMEEVFRTGQSRTLLEDDEAARGGENARSFRAQVLPEFAADGTTVESVLTVTTEITDLKRAEEALQAATAAAEAAQREEERRRHEAERREQIAESLRDVLAVLNSNREVTKTLDYIARQAAHLLSSDAAAIYTTGTASAHGAQSLYGLHHASGHSSGAWASPASKAAPESLTLQAAVGISSLRPSGTGKLRLPVDDATIRIALETRRPVAVLALPTLPAVPSGSARSHAASGHAHVPTRSSLADAVKPAELPVPATAAEAGAPVVALAEQAKREEFAERGPEPLTETIEDYLIVREEPLPAPYRALLAIPIIAQGQVYGGLLLLYTSPRRFSADEVVLAMAYGDQIALAMANARLQQHIEWQAVERERNRLARELHDTVTQEIFTASVLAESIPQVWEHHRAQAEATLRQLHQITRGALAALRALLLELRPAVLEQKTLPELLRQLGEAMTTRSGVPIALDITDDCAAALTPGATDALPLPTDVKVAYYRIAQEALMNAAKYAHARTIVIRLRCLPAANSHGAGIQLEVHDDGQGFAAGSVPPGHFGLGMMRERARAVGATLRISSRPGHGTRVAVKWTKG